MALPRPLADRPRRMPEHGRIRIGQKVDKGRPEKLAAFRFTSADAEAIKQIASLYGGEARPWIDAPTKGQWEVFTTVNQIDVVLPPAPLGDGLVYERWG